ncbi:MAG TPA: phosphatidylglycerophosphatase A [Thermodesulfobacteriota bacterium]
MKGVLLFLATTGLSALPRVPPAPGTFGTLVGGVPTYLLLAQMPAPLAGAGGLAVVALAVLVAGRAEVVLGRHDPGIITVDEVAGFLVTMAGVPPEPRYVAAGLVLFRLFDIVKPYPADRVDARMAGGVGTVLDDCVAGLYAWLALAGLRWVGL